jgi:hypothetical protein
MRPVMSVAIVPVPEWWWLRVCLDSGTLSGMDNVPVWRRVEREALCSEKMLSGTDARLSWRDGEPYAEGTPDSEYMLSGSEWVLVCRPILRDAACSEYKLSGMSDM